MEKNYLVTTMKTYYWFYDKGQMEDFVNTLDEEYLDSTEITHVIQAEDIPVESIRKDYKIRSLEDEIKDNIKQELSKITQEDFDNMPDSVKNFIKNLSYLANNNKHITFKPNPPKGTTIP